MKLFQRIHPFGNKMFRVTTQMNSKGKRSDFLVCYQHLFMTCSMEIWPRYSRMSQLSRHMCGTRIRLQPNILTDFHK